MKTLPALWHGLVCGCPRKDRARLWQGWTRLIFPLMTAMALAWFLCRVIPKPIRANYPCPRAAFPLATSFVLWVLGMKSGLLAWLKPGERFRRLRPALKLAGSICLLALAAAAASEVASYFGAYSSPTAWTPTDQPNSPIGTARGIYPGRVV